MMDTSGGTRTSYRDSLAGDVRTRYDQKISVIGGVDPYALPDSEFEKERTHLPDVKMIDVSYYLVFQHSTYNREQFRNVKALKHLTFFKMAGLEKHCTRRSTLSIFYGLR